MPDTPATNVETSGVYGQTGAIPIGSQATSGSVKDTTEMGAGGSVTARPEPPKMTGTPDTEAVYGPNDPADFTPVSTLLSGTSDMMYGYAGNVTQRNYRAPGATVAGSIKDTTNAIGLTAAVPADNYRWVVDGTIDTVVSNLSAPNGKILTQADNLVISTSTPAAATKTGVIGAAASIVVVNKGQIITVTDESHVLNLLDAFTLTNPGVTDVTTAVVVKKGATVLVENTDYTIAATGTGATRKMTITPIDSATVNSGDTLLVTYHYGNAKYFANATLTLTTDYTVAFAGGLSTRTFTITRVNTAASTNGDTVTATYQYGNADYWASHDPAQVPAAPTIGTAVAGDRKIKVVWTGPTLTANDDVDGYVIMSDTGGTRYVPGGNLNYWFENVVPGQSYQFKVASFNEKGLGPFSALSNAVVPLNFDEVPSGSLDPKNTVNPIYNADGTIVAGSNLGP
jgi:hypothetical protein